MSAIFKSLYAQADAAGRKAVADLKVTPMVLQEVDIFDKPYAGSKTYFVEDGACGFAWVTIRPANCAFAKWLRLKNLGDKAYGGGVQIWVSDFNQSVQKKEAYADAFAAVLKDYGIKAFSNSRLD